MSNQALDLLIDCELLKPNGKPINIYKIPKSELSRRFSHFIQARQESIHAEFDVYLTDSKLNAQFSTSSSKFSKENTLSSLLVYNRIILDDPLVSPRSSISMDDLYKGLQFYSWLHPLIRSGFVNVYPIDYYNNPSEDIPILRSEDAFRSSISPEIHDYAHKHAALKSTITEDGRVFVLQEDASIKRRSALTVTFENDRFYSGVSMFRFERMENFKSSDGKLHYDKRWDKDEILSEEKFKQWAYQATNQAIMARLKAICNQASLAQKLGHTYITESESEFESTLLSLSNTQGAEPISPGVKFLNLNESFLNIESPNTIIELRNKYSTAFERFNSTLISASEDLHGVEIEEFNRKCKTLFQNEIMPQVDEIRSAIGQISSGLLKGTLTSLSSVSLAISTGSTIALVPALIATATMALSETIPTLRELQLKKQRPGYIWHRLTM